MPRRPLVSEMLTDGKVSRQPFWLKLSGRSIASWLHLPTGSDVRPNAVVICPPFGFEYAHAHRTLLHLADDLAAEGFAVVRFEYTGTGTSSGDEETPSLLQHWLDDIGSAMEIAERLTGGGAASLVGLRMGALLAGRTSELRDVQSLVAWAPVLKGKRFIREIRALHNVSAGPDAADDGFLEAGGFRISATTAEDISGIDFPKTHARILTEALVIDRTDQPIARLPQSDTFGIPVTHAEQSDFADMLAEPHFTRVPSDTLATITSWLARTSPSTRLPLNQAVVEELSKSRSATIQSPGGQALTEEVAIVSAEDGSRIVGVLCQRSDRDGQGEVVLMPNAGSVHHMGPNRLYVELARELAAVGVPSMRFDLRNLGDARIGASPDENHPYPSTANDDVGLAVRWLTAERGFSSVAVSGLCSGAHAAFHAGLEVDGPEISRIVSINPLTFRFEEGMTLETPMSQVTTREARYYRSALRSRSSWIRLLTGKTSIPYLIRFVGRRVGQRLDAASAGILRRVGIRGPGPLERDLLQLHESRRPVHFVFSSGDPGVELLADQAGVTVARLTRAGSLTTSTIPDADHTFSKHGARRLAITEVRRHFAGAAAGLSCRELPFGPELWATLRPTWIALREGTGDTSAFLSETWVGQWLEWFGKERNARGLIWTNANGDPVGCALLSTDRGRAGPFSVSRVFLNASGVPGVGCEHNDILALPEYRDAVVEDLAIQLDRLGTDQIALTGIRASLFEQLVGDRSVSWEGLSSEAPYASLAEIRTSGDDFISSLSSNTRRQIRRGIRGYEDRFGPLDFSEATSGTSASEMLEEMFPLHDARWSTRGSASGFTPEARRFHIELVRRISSENPPPDLSASLCRIRFGEETIGILYHLECAGKVHFFQGGLKYHDDQKLKPGMVSHALAAQHCLEQGFDEYDLLGGEPDPVRYKTSLTTHRRTLYWGSIGRPTRKTRLIARLRRISRGIRRQADQASPTTPES